jgi:hypothetical protein
LRSTEHYGCGFAVGEIAIEECRPKSCIHRGGAVGGGQRCGESGRIPG